MRYTVVLQPDPEEGGYVVTVPALPGVVTQGETVEECRVNVTEAIEVYLESLRREGLPLPTERVPPELLQVEVA